MTAEAGSPGAATGVFVVVVVVVVVESPQTPEDDPEERLRTRWETGTYVDGLLKVQFLAVRVESGATEPQVVDVPFRLHSWATKQ